MAEIQSIFFQSAYSTDVFQSFKFSFKEVEIVLLKGCFIFLLSDFVPLCSVVVL